MGGPKKLLIGLQHPTNPGKNLQTMITFPLMPDLTSSQPISVSLKPQQRAHQGECTSKKKFEKGAQEDDYEWWSQLSLDLHYPLWFIIFLVDTSPKFSFIKCYKRFDQLNRCYFICKKASNLGGLEVAVTKNPSLFQPTSSK